MYNERLLPSTRSVYAHSSFEQHPAKQVLLNPNRGMHPTKQRTNEKNQEPDLESRKLG